MHVASGLFLLVLIRVISGRGPLPIKNSNLSQHIIVVRPPIVLTPPSIGIEPICLVGDEVYSSKCIVSVTVMSP